MGRGHGMKRTLPYYSQPGQEFPARPRNPNQAKKFGKTKTFSEVKKSIKVKKSLTDRGSQESRGGGTQPQSGFWET